ncbi:hypothetical protein NKJ40_27355 [Mesorhizobium sp. M0119]|uniref:hypothetical protein n=1 Tax=unclassified Mesorhizobium TaxID=325217 RepID=UPI0033363262
MAVIAHVFMIRRLAQILGQDEDLLWDLSDQLEPEDGKLWVYDIDGIATPVFSDFGIEALREIIRDQATASCPVKSGTPRSLPDAYGLDVDRRGEPMGRHDTTTQERDTFWPP